MFTGLNAFPLTPLAEDGIDEAAFTGLIERLAAAGVDAITALGSTGSYAYLTRTERARTAHLAVAAAGEVPVMVGIGALRTRHVLEAAEDAQRAGAAGVLLAPVSYQALTHDDVYGLYADVTAELSVPLAVYDNPGTTHFAFDDELYAAIAKLPGVASIKIPGVPADPGEARARIDRLRALLPDRVTLGVSGDACGAAGLAAGCDAWYSVIAGTLPQAALAIARPALAGDRAAAHAASERLAPLWEMFAAHGSLRPTAAIAEQLGLVARPCLPLPIRGLGEGERARLAGIVADLGLDG
ncbi:dihydrodipicolinate synthase family protein [Brevibacterium sp. 5221]|uniref:Dihydrodipicolinate synthase family protein n=1 Tax=Brevibacterium rongguiense TaxID=2695267 RepID=A0A6N9H6P5_9MICO|nr:MULTISPECIES: dihydrodipicolinate synthase family protein [Brevibacterium]MYM19575.1 dihydrodipicolinate synthase family protein [Brevibacterium rongguiense]WAL40561.1 dihydrodipicolinate synthase family protein [Brevibacterium sp. BRM-1]